MPKLKGPLLSLGATGGLTKLFSLARRMGRNIIERKPIPANAKSPAQLFNRHMFTKCTALWHLLSEAEKAEWERLATPRHMTGYAWYISQCLRPNPGIYLPLQGGTMSGDIDMDKNRLLKLPEPTDSQEAMRNTLTTGKVWQGDAANKPAEVDPPAGEAATKEFFICAFGNKTTGAEVAFGWWQAIRLVAGSVIQFTLKCPHDFTALTSCKILGVKSITATIDWTVNTQFAAVGEIYGTHADSDTGDGLAMTNQEIEEVDISAAFTNLSADDYVGVRFNLDAIEGGSFEVLGLSFKYS
ncbi:hypothetical protein ES708_29066 [subsurface metagenome]